MRTKIRKTVLIFLIAGAICNFNVTAQTITTVAGYSLVGYSGDGGLATNAKLNTPCGVYTDATGNIYFADQNNNRIRKVDVASGIISTVAGNGTAGYTGDGGAAISAQLNLPTGIYVDGPGNIYFTDLNNAVVRKVTASTGIITTIVGNGVGTYAGDGGLATSASLHGPTGVCLDASGNIYIADLNNGRVRKVTASTGIITTIAGNGLGGFSGDGGAAINAGILPNAICLSPSSDLYITDGANNRIRKLTVSTGIINTIAGTGTGGFSGDGGPAISAKFAAPSGICLDAQGDIYISDLSNGRIRKITVSTGVITTIAGDPLAGALGDGGPAINASVNSPYGVCFDVSGNLFIGEYSGPRIRKVSFPPAGIFENKTFNNKLELYPNPSNGIVSIIGIKGISTIKVFDSFGKLILEQKSECNASINTSHLLKGIYSVIVESVEGKSVNKMLID